MDETIRLVLATLFAAGVPAAAFWRAARSARMRKEKDDRRSAMRHRRITRQYREEQSRLGE